MELNLGQVFDTIFSQGFQWENNIDYVLKLVFSYNSTNIWTATPSACYISGGFLNYKGDRPTCTVHSTTTFSIRYFQEIVEHSLLGDEIIKL